MKLHNIFQPILFGLLATAAIASSADVPLTADGKVPGQPFEVIQTQIDGLQGQIDTIQLTPGPQGTAGANGINCWDLNGNGLNDPVENTNGDLVFDALDCKGPKGDQGDQGIQGAQGPKGEQGDAGLKGDQGEAGPVGPQGLPGLQGVDGADGAQGPEGPQGLTGPAGADGVAGAQGPSGLSCWDTNENGMKDNSEDLNKDGLHTALDCKTSGTRVSGNVSILANYAFSNTFGPVSFESEAVTPSSDGQCIVHGNIRVSPIDWINFELDSGSASFGQYNLYNLRWFHANFSISLKNESSGTILSTSHVVKGQQFATEQGDKMNLSTFATFSISANQDYRFVCNISGGNSQSSNCDLSYICF